MASYKELLLQRAELEKEIEVARRTEASAAIAEVRRLITEYDLTARDCGFKFSGADAETEKTRTPVAVKYYGPEGQTWTGRGRAPGWLLNLEAQGRDRNEFLV